MAAPRALRLSVPDLRSDGFILRSLGEADPADFVQQQPDAEMRRWLTIRADPVTEDVVRMDLIGPAQAGWRDGTMAHFAIYAAADRRLLGTISLRFYRHEIAEVGYDLMPKARGRGIATEAVRLVSAWAFKELRIERIELRTHPENLPSQRVAERAGFTREGIERRSRRLYNERHDCVVFSLLASDR